MNYPHARIQPTAVSYGRVRYTDDYQWLEEETAEALAWEAEQDRLAQDWLRNTPARARAEALIDAMPRISADFPSYSGGRWFQRRTPSDRKMQVLEVADSIDGPWRCIVDLNQMSAGRMLAADSFVPSPDGRKLLFSLGVDGNELAELRVVDVDNGTMLVDSVRQIRPFFAVWSADSSGFYYTAIDPAVSMEEMRVFRQVLGAAPVTRPEAYEMTHPMTWAKSAGDGRHLFIIADHLNPRPDYIRDDTTGEAWRPFLKGETALFRGEIIGDRYYAVTDEGAPCGRLVSIPLATPTDRSTWTELLAGSENVLGTLFAVDGLLVLADLVDCYSRMRVFDTEGRLKGEIGMPGHGSMSAINFVIPNMLDMFAKGSSGDVLFPFSTAAQSPALYRANVHTLEVEALTRPLLKIDARFQDHSAISADGARVPYNVIARADVDLTQPQPTAIYGYGGFAVALVPSWVGTWLAAWVQAGGVLVLGHLRGGGELGPEMWHQGRLLNKQNSFNDVYAIAEDLIARRITTAAQLGVVGGSNGGAMAAAAVVQRPDLFRAAISQVPITDALARARDPITMGATMDYGDPNDPDLSEALLAWSPYHNIKDGTAYPSLLLDAGKSDVRCPPWHVRKMAARMQPANTSSHPILMRVREGVGHGAADVEGQRAQGSDWLGFFIGELGLAP
ncbi:prolyl oligopeptidase family serine peptidase [Solimonas terrae]|uniref:S9 family peptidase n=1 Tax=Solimonas terrae TaxID=1396819 RepID=A0A6M2BPV9_9GAMM|nr:prolyl oligopeptidase family serine peptidase [Solimonas terrae]NGY04119.1 S9 family peptidase [Solimonas terrae]